MKTERYMYEGRPGSECDSQRSEGALGLEEVVQLVKGLSGKHKNLSSAPQHPCKRLALPCRGRGRRGIFGSCWRTFVTNQ